ncbi:hypothetical protein BKA66DRAFT_300402 [Pyrenochaeta sp. MPI-SDFR-AT-0127]|nr:hypothetical protein BKA66DRAFT_300402 [Pyrenochaeta sp. MPI-SDFR-AT-0127]
MAPSRILDSHIHLWPSTATTSSNHAWMTEGHQLARRHGIADYKAVANPKPSGFVYVETDRYLPSTSPEIDAGDSEESRKRKLAEWAKEPLEEVKFLRRIVEDKSQEGDGFESGDGDLFKGAVIWAPFHLPPTLFSDYLNLAEQTSGPALWQRVAGFRYLLQGKGEGEVKRLVESEDWLNNIVPLRNGRDGKGWVFDVGIDTHRDGVEQAEHVGAMINEVRKREEASSQHGHVRFVLNHLCKAPLSTTPSPHQRWTAALNQLAADTNVFMKLSGAFNEFADQSTPDNVPAVVGALNPFLNHVFTCFPERVMFGSDWPVCNVGGPRGQGGNWGFWVEIVDEYLGQKRLSEKERERVWWGAGAEAYGVEL